MNSSLALLVFMGVFAIISAILWTLLNKNKLKENGIAEFIRAMLFFFWCDYFILSAVKWLLGNGQDTLFESFWDMEARTYIHYGIPLLVISAAEPFLLKLFGKEFGKRLISAFCAENFIILFWVFFITGEISNITYCLSFLVSGISALLTAVLLKKEFDYLMFREYRKVFIKALPVVGAWIFMHGIYLPNELYLNNMGDFSGTYGSFLVILTAISLLVLCVIVAAEIILLPKSILWGANLMIAGMVIMGYIQNMFLNGRLTILNGSEQEWSKGSQFINAVIWILVIGLILISGYLKRNVVKLWQSICVYIVLIQIVTLGYMVVTTDFSEKMSSGAMTTENSLELSKRNNVLVFVLDRLESKWTQKLLDEESEFFDPLADFTFYRNATSQFADTRTSIPYMLTGTEWQEGMGAEYGKYAYENSSFLSDIKKNDYDIGLYTDLGNTSEVVYGIASNYKESVHRKYKLWNTFATMWKSSMYKTTPFCIKSSYSYYTSDIAAMVDEPEVWSTENDLPFYESLKKERISVTDDYANAFRFYHMRGAHEPYYLSEDLQYNKTGRDVNVYGQIKGSMKIVYEYLNQLKELGLYEDATIIITADHGQQTEFLEAEGKPDKTLMPTMLVKKPGEHHKSIVYNEAPVTHTEYLATVAQAAGLDWKQYGNTLDEAPEINDTERVCISLWYGHIIKFTINGDARDLENWRAVEVAPKE